MTKAPLRGLPATKVDGVGSADAARRRAAETKVKMSRRRIVAAATELFETQGWSRTSMQEIAEAAGLGVATVYKHYRTKNILAGHTYLPVVTEFLDDPRWTDPAIPAATALRAFITEFVAHARARTRLTVALLEAVYDSTARNGAAVDDQDPRSLLPLPRVLAGIIYRGQQDGTFLPFPEAADAGPLLFNILMLRIATRPHESVEHTTRLITAIADRTMGVDTPAH